ncbi:MAG: hypothetical protein R3F03_04265 [Opitutaceae bacterium]
MNVALGTNRWVRSPFVVAWAVLAIVITFHSPRWWLFLQSNADTLEWNRATIYLQQCVDPWRDDLTAAVRWRFVPQIFVWLAGGGALLALALPWLGALTLIGYSYNKIRQQSDDGVKTLCATIVLASSGPILVSTGWLGINDAWFVLALCYLAFGEHRIGWVVACLLGTFIDERFIFGLPLALWLRAMSKPDTALKTTLQTAAKLMLAALIPFLVSRLLGTTLAERDTARDGEFIMQSLQQSGAYLWCAPLGAWMALRFAGLPAAEEWLAQFRVNRHTALILLAVTAIPIVVGFTIASDTMRTAGIALPLCVWGICRLVAKKSRLYWLALAAASLLIPAAHVTYNKVMPINSLPIELLRLF